MKCPRCKKAMDCRVGEHHYLESGLDDIILGGVEIYSCSCGEEVVSIPSVPKLHALIGQALIEKGSLLTGSEIRFLRKNVGLTGKRLADIMAVANATISRWESGAQAVSRSHDRLLRLLYASLRGLPPEKTRNLVEEDFSKISDEQLPLKPWMIPKDRWSKSGNCNL